LDIEPPESTDFNVIKEDFKKHQAYGMLAAAIHLAQNCKTGRISKRMSCKQFFQILHIYPILEKNHTNFLKYILNKSWPK
jgi:hypothetical protein